MYAAVDHRKRGWRGGEDLEGSDRGSGNGQREDKKEYVKRRERGARRGGGQEGGVDMKKCCV